MVEGLIVVSRWTVVDVLTILSVVTLWFRYYGIVLLLVEVHHQLVDLR